MQGLNAQNQYNLTIVEPSFAAVPWYADRANDPAIAYETFMDSQLVPWVRSTFASTTHEQNWLIGFSKSGYGAIDLVLKHPTTFALAAAWDFPADMSRYDQYGDSANYGTDGNFQSHYRLTSAFVGARKAPFTEVDRIWLSGYNTFRPDMSDFDAMLTSFGMLHTFTKSSFRSHTWGAGWLREALAALYQDSLPTVATFSIPRDYSSLTIPINSFVAIDSVGIAAYRLTEDSTPPSADDPGWSPFSPSSYTFSSPGKKTLYAWTKNAAGAVSPAMSCSVTVEKGGVATLTNAGGGSVGGGGSDLRSVEEASGLCSRTPPLKAVYLDGGVEFVTVKKGTVAISLFAMFLVGWFVLMRLRSNNRKTAG